MDLCHESVNTNSLKDTLKDNLFSWVVRIVPVMAKDVLDG